MTFAPRVSQELQLGGTTWRLPPHPSAPQAPWSRSGTTSIVYRLDGGGASRALKVFAPEWRGPQNVERMQRLAQLATVPGLKAAERIVLTAAMVPTAPGLVDSLSMPWIEGYNWSDAVRARTPLSPEQCLHLARALATVLDGLEQRGLAHCNLSGNSVMITAGGTPTVELVDLEHFFAPGMPVPQPPSQGTATYVRAPGGKPVWQAQADRFAGAVLLGEILGWCDPAVRQRASEASLFVGEDLLAGMQPERYRLLLDALRATWGDKIGRLFEHAWLNSLPSAGPPFREWLAALPERPGAAQATGAPVDARRIDANVTVAPSSAAPPASSTPPASAAQPPGAGVGAAGATVAPQRPVWAESSMASSSAPRPTGAPAPSTPPGGAPPAYSQAPPTSAWAAQPPATATPARGVPWAKILIAVVLLAIIGGGGYYLWSRSRPPIPGLSEIDVPTATSLPGSSTPSAAPGSPAPSGVPSGSPSAAPSAVPSAAPSAPPSATPSPSPTATPSPGPPVVIGRLLSDPVICRRVGESNEPLEPAKVYDPFATFYCAFKVRGGKKGTRITARWEDPQGFSRTTDATIDKDGDSNLYVSLAPPSGAWTLGNYKVTVEVEGKLELEVPFQVGAKPE